MIVRPNADTTGATARRTRGVAIFLLIMAAQFVVFEAALRVWGSSEAAPSFQALFEGDPVVGVRLKPNTRIRFTTSEFDVQIAINNAGVRDDEDLGPKAPDEKRIVLLGDSLVLSVQVDFAQTFGELLEARLNRKLPATRYRVINAGVQGYGPVEQLMLFRSVAQRLEPDLVIPIVYVGNDAEEAVRSAPRLDEGTRATTSGVIESMAAWLRRLVRRSMVLQILRLRVVAATSRFTATLAPPEPPLQSYLANPAPRIAEGIAITRRCIEGIAETASGVGARTAVVLAPARFQVDDGDYGRLREIVERAGGELIRDGASTRFALALADLPLPMADVLPALRDALPGPDLFFQGTAHLTPRGHEVVAGALQRFIREEGLLDPNMDAPLNMTR